MSPVQKAMPQKTVAQKAMAQKALVKRAVRRGGGAVSVWLPPARGPQPWQQLVGRARIAEAARRLRGLRDAAGAEELVAPLLAGGRSRVPGALTSRAWALVAEARESAGDRTGALAAARTAVATTPVVLDALLVHHRLAGGAEQADALAALIELRPRNVRELEQVLVALRGGSEDGVDRYGTRLLEWGHTDLAERLDETRWEIRLVDAAEGPAFPEVLAAAERRLAHPLPVVVRAMDRTRRWDELASYVAAQPAPEHPDTEDGPSPAAMRALATDLRRAAGRALSGGRTATAETLAGHALALRPDDPWAKETWSNAADQLAVVRRGWRPVERSTRRRYVPRDGAVLSVLAQSLPHTSGGYATRTHGILTGLVRGGWDVEAVTRPGFPYDRWSKHDSRVVAPSDVVDGVTYHRILDERRTYPQYPLADYVEGYAQEIERHARRHRASVIHASSFHVNGLAAQAAAARLGVPFVYEMRGLEELMKVSRDPGFATSERHAFLEHLETAICLHADRVLVITEELKRLMVARGVPEERLVVLPNGVHADRFESRPRDAALEAELGVQGRTVIGYAGGLVDYEGLGLLLDAVALLRERREDFHVVVVGDGPEEHRLRARVAALGLGDLVTFTGRVPHEEVPRYLSLVDVAPFPRLPLPVCEAISPIKPFESMAMGKAVVTSSVAALTEIVTDGVTGLVFDKGCARDLAATLERLIDSPELRGRLGDAASEWVRTSRDWSALVGIVEEVYGALTAGPVEATV